MTEMSSSTASLGVDHSSLQASSDGAEATQPAAQQTPETISPERPVDATQSISPSVRPGGASSPLPVSPPVLASLLAAVLLLIGSVIRVHSFSHSPTDDRSVLALLRRRKASVNGSAILLTGPSDAGKTAILSGVRSWIP